MPTRFTRDGADEAFSALTDEVRIQILCSLRSTSETALSFSELQEAVAVTDSGRFNYHLDKLQDRFIRQCETGYELTQAGKRIVGAIESGAYTASGEVKPIPLEAPCRACGGLQEFSYRDGHAAVECTSCMSSYKFAVPPVVFIECDRAAIPDRAARHLRTTIRQQYDGFCTFCSGPLVQTLEPAPDINSAATPPTERSTDDFAESIHICFKCPQCGATAYAIPVDVFLEHPSVIAFYDENGINVRQRHPWAFPSADDVAVRVLEDDPLQICVTYSHDGGAVSVYTDEKGSVYKTE